MPESKQLPTLTCLKGSLIRGCTTEFEPGRQRFLGTDDPRLHTLMSSEGASVRTADQHIRRRTECTCPMLRRLRLINPWNGLINPARV
jgi:hypothetical protein